MGSCISDPKHCWESREEEVGSKYQGRVKSFGILSPVLRLWL